MTSPGSLPSSAGSAAAADQIKAWALPLTLAIIGVLGLQLWNNQQGIIGE